jgi:hypothetical protein
MQFESVCRVTVGDFLFQVGGEVDDGDGFKWAFFDTDTTTNAKFFRDESDFGVAGDFNAEFSCSICIRFEVRGGGGFCEGCCLK